MELVHFLFIHTVVNQPNALNHLVFQRWPYLGFDAGIFECFNTMINPIQDDETLDELVLSALRRTPDRCAFIYDNDEISCAELLRAADSLSENLASKNLQTGEPVALFVRPGIELVVGMLAILMAGGCVVPIDTTLNEERQNRILIGVKPRIAVTNLLLNEIRPELGKNVIQYQFSRQNLKGSTVNVTELSNRLRKLIYKLNRKPV